MAELFKGKKLIKKSGDDLKEVEIEKALHGKVVALYFSGHWCPPCRAFTPVLKKFYDDLKGEPFEVIFVSSDQSEEEMKTYLKESHGDWCCVPFGDEFIQELKKKFSVRGIPMMVVIKPNGDVIEADGRDQVQSGKKKAPVLFAEWKTACGF